MSEKLLSTFKGSEWNRLREIHNCQHNFGKGKRRIQIFVNITMHTPWGFWRPRKKESTIENIFSFSSVDCTQEANWDNGSHNNWGPPIASGTIEFWWQMVFLWSWLHLIRYFIMSKSWLPKEKLNGPRTIEPRGKASPGSSNDLCFLASSLPLCTTRYV